MIAIAANENFKIRALDVTNAFLQGKPLEREVFVEPPKDLKKPGEIWKLKKMVYSLYNGSWVFYKAIDKDLIRMGATRIIGEEALNVFHEGEGENFGLSGLVGVHADDFNTMGTDDFHKKVTDKLQEVYVFGKVENNRYRFTVKETSEGIEVNQKTYCDSLQEIKIENGRDNDRPLTVQEYKEFRGAIGKLNWLQESTRLDLSYDTLSLSMKNRSATVRDLKKMNKVIKKAKVGADESKIRYKKINKFENF